MCKRLDSFTWRELLLQRQRYKSHPLPPSREFPWTHSNHRLSRAAIVPHRSDFTSIYHREIKMSGNNSNNSSSGKKPSSQPSIPRDSEGNPIIGATLARNAPPARSPRPRESLPDVSRHFASYNTPEARSPQPSNVSRARPSSIYDGIMASTQNIAPARREQQPSEIDDEEMPAPSGSRRRNPFPPGVPLPWQPPEDTNKPFEKGIELPGEARRARHQAEVQAAEAAERAQSHAGRLLRIQQKEQAEKKRKGGEGEK